MKTYHLFGIKKELYEVYKNKTYSLYKLLYNLYNLNKSDLSYGITLYNQICDVINIKKLKYYFELLDKVRIGKNKYQLIENNEKNTIIIKPSHIIYKTNNPNETILYLLDNYSNYIFMCNFKDNDFYWIKEKIND